MSTKSELLKLLTENRGEFISGQAIAAQLGVSRNSIWKAVARLKEDGYLIESRTNAGYRLVSKDNILTVDEVMHNVTRNCSLEIFDTVTSTNDLLKEKMAAPGPHEEPLVCIANRQTGGRGRLGRKFESPAGTGLYISFGLKPTFDIDKALFVTMASAVATCRAIEKICPIKAEIKWVNDIFVNEKKVCGILTEGVTNFENGKIDSLVIGIGINCFPGSFPPEIADKAGTLAQDPSEFRRSMLAAEVINEVLALIDVIETREFFKEYRKRCFILGRPIRIHPNYNDIGIPAAALDIADDGGLIVEYTDGIDKGKRETLHTGEISISIGH